MCSMNITLVTLLHLTLFAPFLRGSFGWLHHSRSGLFRVRVSSGATKANSPPTIKMSADSSLPGAIRMEGNLEDEITSPAIAPITPATTGHDILPANYDDKFLNEVLQVAIDASKKAGAIIVGNAGGAEVTNRKANSRDLLTLIDPLCEQIIRETVLAAFPHHRFLGEEDVPPGKEASAAALEAALSSDVVATSESSGEETKTNNSNMMRKSREWLWIVDPIDGTTNFVHGIPICMPSVAATYRGEVMVGVIYDCHRDELFTAIKGRGAFMNGGRITVGKQDLIGDAIVAMGSPPAPESLRMSLKGAEALMPVVRTIRMLGSAAVMLAWVANGRLTCYWEYDLSSWDIAAGALLVTEAGGRFTDLTGHDYSLRTRKICASNGLVHDEVLSVLKSAGVQ